MKTVLFALATLIIHHADAAPLKIVQNQAQLDFKVSTLPPVGTMLYAGYISEGKNWGKWQEGPLWQFRRVFRAAEAARLKRKTEPDKADNQAEIYVMEGRASFVVPKPISAFTKSNVLNGSQLQKFDPASKVRVVENRQKDRFVILSLTPIKIESDVDLKGLLILASTSIEESNYDEVLLCIKKCELRGLLTLGSVLDFEEKITNPSLRNQLSRLNFVTAPNIAKEPEAIFVQRMANPPKGFRFSLIVASFFKVDEQKTLISVHSAFAVSGDFFRGLSAQDGKLNVTLDGVPFDTRGLEKFGDSMKNYLKHVNVKIANGFLAL